MAEQPAAPPLPPPIPSAAERGPDPVEELGLLIASRYPLLLIESGEEERVEALLHRLAARLQVPLAIWSVAEGLRRAGTDQAIYETRAPEMALATVAEMSGDGLWLFKGLERHLDQPEIQRRLQDLSRAPAGGKRAVILTAAMLDLPAEIERLAARYRLRLPSTEELTALAREVAATLQRERGVRLEITKTDFRRLVEGLRGFTFFEAERALSRVMIEDGALTGADVARLGELKTERLRQDGIVEVIPSDGGLARLGGLSGLKAWVTSRSRAFGPEARAFGIAPPRGIVLLGVQGCGKTMAARAIAGEWGTPLLRLEPGRLYDRFVGESEKNLDRALQIAERMSPCVLLVDEIEKGFSSVGSGDTDGGLSRRIFGRLLGWLQDRAEPVFTVATCNAVRELPPELMRKGRFDEIFFLDLPAAEERREILSSHLARRRRDPQRFALDAVVAATDGFSGAELEQVVVAALTTVFSRGGELATEALVDEARRTVPLSVTRREEIESLRTWARGRAVPASGAAAV